MKGVSADTETAWIQIFIKPTADHHETIAMEHWARFVLSTVVALCFHLLQDGFMCSVMSDTALSFQYEVKNDRRGIFIRQHIIMLNKPILL